MLKKSHILFNSNQKKNQITDMDAFMLFFPWWKKSRFIRFQCVKLFCPKIWSCKVFYLHLWWYFLLYSHLVCFEQACFFLKIPFKSWNLNCHSKQVDEWVCTISVFQFSLKCSPGLHPLLGIPRLAVSLGDENISYTGCFFSKGPTQKSSKYGIGPSQQDRIAKYTGPTQSYQRSKE